MKRIVFLLITFFCLLPITSCDFIVKNVYVDGIGSGGDGGTDGGGGNNNGQINWNAANITISTEAHLRELATRVNNGTNNFNGRTITLANDIELIGGEWVPIGNGVNWLSDAIFFGTFNGNGKVISGIFINQPDKDNQGVFGLSHGIIKNLGVIVNITGKSFVGGLVGHNNAIPSVSTRTYGKIENCYVLGNVSGTGNFVGGLAGQNGTGNLHIDAIVNCYVVGSIEGNNYVGGLVGSNTNGLRIFDSYFTGSVSVVGNNEAVGGLAGYNDGTISRCYASGNVVGNKLVGQIYHGVSTALLISENAMKQQSTYIDWDFDNIWKISPDINNGFPHLRVFN